MIGDIAIAFLLAITTTFVLVPYSIRFAKKVGAIDVPNDRRVNKKPIPRLGGIAVIGGFLVSTIFLMITTSVEGKIDFVSDNMHIKLIGFLVGLTILGIICLIDDIKGLKAVVKLVGQLIAAIIVVRCGIIIDSFKLFGDNMVANEIFNNIVTIVWIVTITNAINLIDGLDGLSSGICLIACVSLIIVFAMNESSPMISILLATALAGSITGFLPYNVHPAKTFIGDVGSNFMGFAIGVISIIGVAKTYTAIVIIAPIIILGLPILDTVWAVIRRAIKTKSIKGIFKADKGHIHHRLMQKGFTQKQSVLILYIIAVTFGMVAIILLDSGLGKAIAFIAVLVVMVFIWSIEKKRQKKEKRRKQEKRKKELAKGNVKAEKKEVSKNIRRNV